MTEDFLGLSNDYIINLVSTVLIITTDQHFSYHFQRESSNNILNTMSYATIDNRAAAEGTAMIPEISVPRSTELKAFVGKSKDKLIIGGLIGLCVVVGALMMNGFSAGNLSGRIYQDSYPHGGYQSQHQSEHHHSKKHHHFLPKKCTFEECNAASCDVDTAPFTCVRNNGGVHGGCSPRPWAREHCEHQCDLSDCEYVRIPISADSCKYVKCDKAWCASNNTVRCPDAAPYQCLEGSAKFGCSTDLDMWGFKTVNTTCSKCCDTVTCEDDEYY